MFMQGLPAWFGWFGVAALLIILALFIWQLVRFLRRSKDDDDDHGAGANPWRFHSGQ